MIKYKQKKYPRHLHIPVKLGRRHVKQKSKYPDNMTMAELLTAMRFMCKFKENIQNGNVGGGIIESITFTRGNSNETWSKTTLNGEEI